MNYDNRNFFFQENVFEAVLLDNDLKKQHELVSNGIIQIRMHLRRKWLQLKDNVERNSLLFKFSGTEWSFK